MLNCNTSWCDLQCGTVLRHCIFWSTPPGTQHGRSPSSARRVTTNIGVIRQECIAFGVTDNRNRKLYERSSMSVAYGKNVASP